MYTLEINKHNAPKAVQIGHGKHKVKSGSEEHKFHIWSRTLEAVKKDETYTQNNWFEVIANKHEGILCSLEEEYFKVEWDGLKCKLLELYNIDTNDYEMFHPSELKLVTGESK